MTHNKLWLKMQTTGGNPRLHQPIEIVGLVTDGILGIVLGKTNILVRTRDFTIWESTQKERHTDSGMVELIDFKGYNLETADVVLNAFLSRFFEKEHKIVICGDCVALEKSFIEELFPTSAKRLSNCVIDVTAFRETVRDLEQETRHRPLRGSVTNSNDTEEDLELTRQETISLIGRIQTLGSII